MHFPGREGGGARRKSPVTYCPDMNWPIETCQAGRVKGQVEERGEDGEGEREHGEIIANYHVLKLSTRVKNKKNSRLQTDQLKVIPVEGKNKLTCCIKCLAKLITLCDPNS